MRSAAGPVHNYLAKLAPERREIVGHVHDSVNASPPANPKRPWTLESSRGRFRSSATLRPTTRNLLGLRHLPRRKTTQVGISRTLYPSDARRKDFEERLRASGSEAGIGKSCTTFCSFDYQPIASVVKTMGSTTINEFIVEYKSARS